VNDIVFEPAGARILVTGATGFVGGEVARRLVALGAQVTRVSLDEGMAAVREWATQAHLL
jgi:uncharacterized protein YbjT (DUF2867 family)